MKFNSELFDSIRIGSKAKSSQSTSDKPVCSWKGCCETGSHPAPRGRSEEGNYYTFCLDHVRPYNKSYNYFSGMNDEKISHHIKQNATGHRPTWKMGQRQANAKEKAMQERLARMRNIFGFSGHASAEQQKNRRFNRIVKRLDKRALEQLGLPMNADSKAIRAQYKQLVKQHHPDANGGDRTSEARLREIIAAYNQLKKSGLTGH